MPTYDQARRKRAQRRGREKGCWVYVPAEALQTAGFTGEQPPFYRVWARPRAALVQFYREP